jgi:hypothetical protein
MGIALLAAAGVLFSCEAGAQGFGRQPELPVFSVPAVVHSYDLSTRKVSLRLRNGRIVQTELAWSCRIMRDGTQSDTRPTPGERLYFQANEPDFPEVIAIWDPLTFCAYGKREHYPGEVRLVEPNVLEVTSGSRFSRRRRQIYKFDLTPRTQLWIEGRRVSAPATLPAFEELDVVVDPDGTVAAVFDSTSWRIYAALELRRSASQVAFLD